MLFKLGEQSKNWLLMNVEEDKKEIKVWWILLNWPDLFEEPRAILLSSQNKDAAPTIPQRVEVNNFKIGKDGVIAFFKLGTGLTTGLEVYAVIRQVTKFQDSSLWYEYKKIVQNAQEELHLNPIWKIFIRKILPEINKIIQREKQRQLAHRDMDSNHAEHPHREIVPGGMIAPEHGRNSLHTRGSSKLTEIWWVQLKWPDKTHDPTEIYMAKNEERYTFPSNVIGHESVRDVYGEHNLAIINLDENEDGAILKVIICNGGIRTDDPGDWLQYDTFTYEVLENDILDANSRKIFLTNIVPKIQEIKAHYSHQQHSGGHPPNRHAQHERDADWYSLDGILQQKIPDTIHQIKGILDTVQEKYNLVPKDNTKLNNIEDIQWSKYVGEALNFFTGKEESYLPQDAKPKPLSIAQIAHKFDNLKSQIPTGNPTFHIVHKAEARLLYMAPTASNAIVQLASQFNFLESVGPQYSTIPEYFHDGTQGSEASLGSLAALIIRDHFFKMDAPQPIFDGLHDPLYQHGYLQLWAIDQGKLPKLLEKLKTKLLSLRILAQWGFPELGGGHPIMQVFTAAPSYQNIERPAEGSPGAQICDLLVVAQYQAIAQLAVMRSLHTRSERVPLHLTLVGQGAFKNPYSVLNNSLKAVYEIVKNHNIDVYIHSFRGGKELTRIRECFPQSVSITMHEAGPFMKYNPADHHALSPEKPPVAVRDEAPQQHAAKHQEPAHEVKATRDDGEISLQDYPRLRARYPITISNVLRMHVPAEMKEINEILKELRLQSIFEGLKWGSLRAWIEYVKEAVRLVTEKIRANEIQVTKPEPLQIGEIDAIYRAVNPHRYAVRPKAEFCIVQGVDPKLLPLAPSAKNAIVQVVSKFNFLQSNNQDYKNITDYLSDQSQGSQASLGSLAALIVRDYYFQKHDPQNIFRGVHKGTYQNGYLRPASTNKTGQNKLLETLLSNIGKLCILAQWGIPDLSPDDSPMLQVFTGFPSYEHSGAPPVMDSTELRIYYELLNAQYTAIAQLAALRSLEPSVGQVNLHITLGDTAFWKGLGGILKASLVELCYKVNAFNVKVFFHLADKKGSMDLSTYLPRGLNPAMINAHDFLGAGNTAALAQAQPPEVIAETPVAVRRGWWGLPSFSGLYKGIKKSINIKWPSRLRKKKKRDSATNTRVESLN